MCAKEIAAQWKRTTAYRVRRMDGPLYDLVLMDVQMPKTDGLEAARRIRAAETAAAAGRTRMIALTADVQEEDRNAVLAAAPLDRERLCEVLDATLANSSNPLAARAGFPHTVIIPWSVRDVGGHRQSMMIRQLGKAARHRVFRIHAKGPETHGHPRNSPPPAQSL
jgi:CheY-like chemotaxis protein